MQDKEVSKSAADQVVQDDVNAMLAEYREIVG